MLGSQKKNKSVDTSGTNQKTGCYPVFFYYIVISKIERFDVQNHCWIFCV